jgi:hypothetical protein
MQLSETIQGTDLNNLIGQKIIICTEAQAYETIQSWIFYIWSLQMLPHFTSKNLKFVQMG